MGKMPKHVMEFIKLLDGGLLEGQSQDLQQEKDNVISCPSFVCGELSEEEFKEMSRLFGNDSRVKVLQKLREDSEKDNVTELTDEVCLNYLKNKYGKDEIIEMLEENKNPVVVIFVENDKDKKFIFHSDDEIQDGFYILNRQLVYAKNLKKESLNKQEQHWFGKSKEFHAKIVHYDLINALKAAMINSIGSCNRGNSHLRVIELTEMMLQLEALVNRDEEHIMSHLNSFLAIYYLLRQS